MRSSGQIRLLEINFLNVKQVGAEYLPVQAGFWVGTS